MSKVELTNFQKRFLLGQGAGQTLYTEKEFEEALAQAKAEIMAVAIQTSKQAIFIERDACASLLNERAEETHDLNVAGVLREMAEQIRNRIPSQRQ
jgi:thiazole synthase ThiGH ThiG subunit